MPDTDTSIEMQVEGKVATIRFNRPDRLNALDLDTATRFGEAVDACLAVDAIRVISIRATGRAFVAGGDLAFFDQAEDKRAAAETIVSRIHEPLKRLAAADKITIGSVKGPVAGAGMSLALGLDLLVAADDTAFSFAYTKIGAPVDCGGSWSLPRLVGLRKALEIALFSEAIDARQALAMGLVNVVVPRDDLEAESDRWAQRIAEGAPIAFGHVKRLMRAALETDYATQLDQELAAFAACAETADFAGAVSAFLARKKHNFEGR